MIIDLCLAVVGAALGLVLGLLPSWSFSVPQPVRDLFDMLQGLDDLFPVSSSFWCLIAWCFLTTAFVTVKWAIKVVDYIADVIP